MAQKAIHIQMQNIGNNNIPPTKQIAWMSANFDNIKITVDAYKGGSGYSGKPREDCLIEIVDSKEVFELTAEQLLNIIRFYVEYATRDDVVHYRNKFHYIIQDEVRKAKKG